MNHLSFLLWMLLFPVVVALEAFVYERLLGRVYSPESRGVGAVVHLCIYAWVGWLLY